MDSPKQETQVFHFSSIPVDRATRQRQARKSAYRFCVYALIVALAVFGAAVIIGISYFATYAFNVFFFPTKQHALKAKHVQLSNASQVHPLIDKSSTFDIQATVWQDVTDLLARGQELPQRETPWKFVKSVVFHRSPLGNVSETVRTEAILYSGKIARGTNLQSKIHTMVTLQIPIVPLYTSSNLGPSSLRATFSVAIPQDQVESFGSFRNVSYMFPTNIPILPRRPDIGMRNASHDLNTALADAGVSTSLLDLVPSPWFRTDQNGTAAGRNVNAPVANPFFSARYDNLRFLEPAVANNITVPDHHLPEFRGTDGRILIPHIKTRTRVGIVRATDVFDNTTFQQQHRIGRQDMQATCSNYIGGYCERPYTKHSFETMLSFARPSDSSAQPLAHAQDEVGETFFYYAPVLTQASAPDSPRYQRRIPQRMPSQDHVDEPAILRGNASVQCEIPPARLDDSRQFFEFDWQIYISAHTLQRVAVAESGFLSAIRPSPAPLKPGEEQGKQLIANAIASHNEAVSVDKFLTGDRYHANDHPGRMVVSSFVMLFWHVVIDEFLIFFFWYSRRTSAGLWIEAQWLWVAIRVLDVALPMIRPVFVKGSSSDLSFFGLIMSVPALLHLPFLVTTMLHLERPPDYSTAKWWRRNPLAFRRRRLTRRERKSIALAGTINKKPFYLIFAACFVLQLARDHRWLQFTSYDLCTVDGFGGKSSVPLAERIFEDFTSAFKGSLLQIYLLGRIWFNHRSGTFTGSFRISAIGSAMVLFIMAIVVGIDSFSGHPDKNHSSPFGVESILDLIPLAWCCYQALTYRGVPQVEPADDEDD